MVNVVYFLTGGMWAYYVYICWGDKFFSPGNMPALKDMSEQIKVNIVLLYGFMNRTSLQEMADFCLVMLVDCVVSVFEAISCVCTGSC